MVFVQYPNLLKRLVAELLSIRLESIKEFEIRNPEVPPEVIGDKFCRLDINMTVDGQRVDLEIQVEDQKDYPERSLYYWAREYSTALSKGKTYAALPRTIIISIVAFPLFDCAEFHSEFQPLEVTRHTRLTDKLALHYFELPKLPEIVTPDDELKLWLSLFNAETEEDIAKLEAMEVSIMQEAIEAYRHVAATDEFKEIARLRARARHNEASALSNARNQGWIEGEQKGRIEGEQKGRIEGEQKGRIEGEQKGKIEVARNALRKKLPVETIAELTGLPAPEIEQLASDV